MVDFSYKLASAFPENAVHSPPPPQQFKTAPPGNLTAAAPTVQDGSARESHRRRPNSSRRLRPGISPGNTDRVLAQATPWASTRRTARAGLGLRLCFLSWCCAASAGLSSPETAPQYAGARFSASCRCALCISNSPGHRQLGPRALRASIPQRPSLRCLGGGGA